MTLELWTLAIALITAFTCALCGALLVVKREALVCEGLSHAVLPGIIVAFVLLRDRTSPLLIAAAAVMGLVMVLLVRSVHRTRLVDADASLGIVFSAMFSGGIILANLNLRNTHFHAHCIIDGNLALAPLDTLRLGGVDWGPRPFYIMLAILLGIVVFLTVFFKELKLMMFDEPLAKSFGFRPGMLHICWLGLVSITTVGAFDTAGSILVVALMIAPAAAAYLLTDRLLTMLLLSCLIGGASAVAGFVWGMRLDISPTGPMSAAAGLLFLLTLMFAPKRGLLSRWRRRRGQQRSLYQHLVLAHLADAATATQDTISQHLMLTPRQLQTTLTATIHNRWVDRQGPEFRLTDLGREKVNEYL